MAQISRREENSARNHQGGSHEDDAAIFAVDVGWLGAREQAAEASARIPDVDDSHERRANLWCTFENPLRFMAALQQQEATFCPPCGPAYRTQAGKAKMMNTP